MDVCSAPTGVERRNEVCEAGSPLALDSVLFSGDATEVTAWNDWKTPTVTFTLEKETIVKLRVAVENKAAGWG